MHELGIIKQIVSTVCDQLSEQKIKSRGAVKKISFKIGALELHGQESFRQMFGVESQGTPLEGAYLVLTVVPAAIKCSCGHEGPAGGVDHHSDMPIAECPSCDKVCRVEGGRGVEAIDLEVEEPAVKKPRRTAKKS